MIKNIYFLRDRIMFLASKLLTTDGYVSEADFLTPVRKETEVVLGTVR